MSDHFGAISKEAVLTELRLARAGGGGSDSDSSGGSSDSGFSHSSSRSRSDSYSSSGTSKPMTPEEQMLALQVFSGFMLTIGLFFALALYFRRRYARKRSAEKNEQRRLLDLAAVQNPSVWDQAALDQRLQQVFLGFQKAWSDLDAEAMKDLLTDDYYRRAVLEINVLYNQKRRNIMQNVALFRYEIDSFGQGGNGSPDWVRYLVRASADDSLVDTAGNQTLFSDSSTFSELWTLYHENGAWKLALIEQTTADARFIERPIADFASRNGFYYDPDFGWLMMPNRGAIFSATNFGRSDINNHVIGYYRDKIVEFYSYRPNKYRDEKRDKKDNYVVAQAILPVSYHDILVSKRGWFERCPKGLEEHSLESPDFNKKYIVCAHPEDNIGALELLNPKFMVHVEELPYDLNIEVVDNVLYFYTLDRRCSYDQMLQLLSYAFDEMRK